MNQQQGDELIEAMAKETGLNPVRCAEHVALHKAMIVAAGTVPFQAWPQSTATWTLAAWRASNASQTMAAMTEQPQAEDDAKLRDRLVAEAAFQNFRDWHPAATGREVGIFFDAYKAGWNAARAQQEAKV